MADTKHAEERIKQAVNRAAAHALPSYPRFLMQAWKGSTPYALYERLRTLFLPTIWIARLLRIARIVLLTVEASALALLAAALLVVALPAFGIVSFGVLLATLRERRRMNRRLAPFVVGRHVLVLFGEAHMLQDDSYTVLLVCDQLPTRHPAAVACHAPGRVILAREHYFFYLRRTLLQKAARVALLF